MEDKLITIPKCNVSKNKLEFETSLSFNEWKEVGKFLKQVEGSVQFWIGDWLNFGKKKYEHGRYNEALKELGYELHSLHQMAWVSDSIECSLRREHLDFSHHKEIASLPSNEQEQWLEKAEEEQLSVRELRTQIKESKKLEENILAPIEGQYEVIVIDPPWPYGTEYNKDTRRVASPYEELSIEQLEGFEMPASDNCVLWLWTTHRFLRDAFNLSEIWGFDYKLTFIWNKEKMGMGVWLRCQIEFCLLVIKGTPRWNLTNERDILMVPRGNHSEKPNEFYDFVENLCPTKGEYADIFSRKERPGWKSYGNEIK